MDLPAAQTALLHRLLDGPAHVVVVLAGWLARPGPGSTGAAVP